MTVFQTGCYTGFTCTPEAGVQGRIVVKIMLVATSVGQKNRRDKFDEWGKEDKKIVLLVS